MFVAEVIVNFIGESTGVLVYSLDMLADALVQQRRLDAVGRAPASQAEGRLSQRRIRDTHRTGSWSGDHPLGRPPGAIFSLFATDLYLLSCFAKTDG